MDIAASGFYVVIFGSSSLSAAVSVDGILFGFCFYLNLQFFNQQRYQADGILFPQTAQTLFVTCN